MSSSIEEKIIRLIQQKDKAFIGLIYDNYADSLYGVVRRMVKDEAAAKDVMQESFMKIWKSSAQYNPQKSRLFTWMLSICRNTAIDRLRVLQKQTTREVQIDDSFVHELGKSDINPDLLDIKDHLKGLEANQQAVIQALFFDGMTQREASEELGIPLGTVKTRLKIALRELRKVFGEGSLLMLITFTFF